MTGRGAARKACPSIAARTASKTGATCAEESAPFSPRMPRADAFKLLRPADSEDTEARYHSQTAPNEQLHRRSLALRQAEREIFGSSTGAPAGVVGAPRGFPAIIRSWMRPPGDARGWTCASIRPWTPTTGMMRGSGGAARRRARPAGMAAERGPMAAARRVHRSPIPHWLSRP